MWSINNYIHVGKVIIHLIERPDYHIQWLSEHLEVGQHDKYLSMGLGGKASRRVREQSPWLGVKILKFKLQIEVNGAGRYRTSCAVSPRSQSCKEM